MDNNVSFKSTYRIPLTEQGINAAKRQRLKESLNMYQNVLFPSNNSGYARVSIRKRLDAKFEQKIKNIGFKVFQKFDRHNIPKTNFEDSSVSKMDLYIKEQLDSKNYKQFGKQK